MLIKGEKIMRIGMNTNHANRNQYSQAFNGVLTVNIYKTNGEIDCVKNFTTGRFTDWRFRKLAQKIMHEESGGLYGRRRLTEKTRGLATRLEALIKSVTGRPLKETNQQKIITNGMEGTVGYSDINPTRGGTHVTLKPNS